MSPRPHSSEIHRVTQSEPRKGISFSRQFRFWVWVNIVLQFFLPLNRICSGQYYGWGVLQDSESRNNGRKREVLGFEWASTRYYFECG